MAEQVKVISFNPNMPLRDLIYVSRQLEKYVRRESIYSSKLIQIPAPRFVVFYNEAISKLIALLLNKRSG